MTGGLLKGDYRLGHAIVCAALNKLYSALQFFRVAVFPQLSERANDLSNRAGLLRTIDNPSVGNAGMVHREKIRVLSKNGSSLALREQPPQVSEVVGRGLHLIYPDLQSRSVMMVQWTMISDFR